MGLGCHELDAATTNGGCLLVQRLLIGGSSRSTGSPHHDEPVTAAASRELAERRDREVRALQLLEPPREEEERPVGVDPERPTRLDAITGSEEGVVNAQRHDRDAVSDDVERAGELSGLHVAACEHGVGARRDGVLGGRARRRGVRRTARLDALDGVEGHEQRHVELVLEGVPSNAREPVVRVNRLVGVLTLEHASEHPFGEGVDMIDQAVLVDRPDRSRGHPIEAHARLDVDQRRLRGRLEAGEDVDLFASSCERGSELADVDVHAPTVAGPGLRERRGVKTQDGEARHGSESLPATFRLTLRLGRLSVVLGRGHADEGVVDAEHRLFLGARHPVVVQDRVLEALSLTGIEDARSHVERLCGDLEPFRDLLEDLGGRPAQTPLDLAQVRVRHLGELAQAAHREPRVLALLADERAQLSEPVGGLLRHGASLCPLPAGVSANDEVSDGLDGDRTEAPRVRRGSLVVPHHRRRGSVDRGNALDERAVSERRIGERDDVTNAQRAPPSDKQESVARRERGRHGPADDLDTIEPPREQRREHGQLARPGEDAPR